MRIVLFVALGLAAAVAVWLVAQPRGPGAYGPPVPAVSDSAQTNARITALEDQVARLEREVQRLSHQLAARTPLPSGTTPSEAQPAAAAPPGDGYGPRWYLAQYVRSFDTSIEGSEYFRLAVDAYAADLLGPISDLVGNPSAHAMLRLKLAAMLGAARFSRNARAIEALITLLRTAGSGGDELAMGALESLDVIGDSDTAVVLERLVWSLDSTRVEQRAIQVIVRLSGPGANRALDRLFASATDTARRAMVIASLSAADPEAALSVFRRASRAEDAVRLHAAQSIQRFRGDEFAAFVNHWLGYERDERVRQVLGAARTQMNRVRAYAAEKATGPPDADPSQDHPNAWASRNPDMGLQWLDLSYRPGRRANAVRIHEVNVAGAVVKVLLFDRNGREHEAWSGRDPTTKPSVFQVNFTTTGFHVHRVRIVLDTNAKPGWAEIDAVQLLGPDGHAWASAATASSSYGQ